MPEHTNESFQRRAGGVVTDEVIRTVDRVRHEVIRLHSTHESIAVAAARAGRPDAAEAIGHAIISNTAEEAWHVRRHGWARPCRALMLVV